MINSTAQTQLSALYNLYNKITYHIPKYQREYTWGKDNWEKLFDDIDDGDKGHFLGSIICINTETDSSEPAQFDLIDGQQRMTTISLFYLAIYQYLRRNIPVEGGTEEQASLINLRNQIIIVDNKSVRLFLSCSNNNDKDYEYAFYEVFPDELNKKAPPSYHGNRKIAKALKYFKDRLDSKDTDGNPVFNYDLAKQLLEKLNTAILVKIEVDNYSDAFRLFETLNNRGVPLSAIDIIKNKLLAELEGNLSNNFDRWNVILKNLADDYKIQERFLRQFYNAFRLYKKIQIGNKSKATRSNLIYIYEQLINKDVVTIFGELETASDIYSKNINYEDGSNSELVKALRSLENVNGADAYMLLLFLESKFDLSEEQKIKLIYLLCCYFIRRNVTDSPPTRDLTNCFMEIIEVLNDTDTYGYEKVRETLIEKGKPASDESFEKKLKGGLYEENKVATRYILASLELAQQNDREGYKNFYDKNKNKFTWSIEHVLPQGENMKDHWVKMIANGDTDEANDIRERWVHKLGNLTLTAYNSNLSDKPLKDKQEAKDKKGTPIGFNNGLALNEELKDADTWNEKSINKRTKQMVDEVLKIFKL